MLQVPTMIVYGTKDKTLGLESVGNLRNMPNSEIMPMEGAGHANYEEKPDEWHRLLYNFLLAVEPKQQWQCCCTSFMFPNILCYLLVILVPWAGSLLVLFSKIFLNSLKTLVTRFAVPGILFFAKKLLVNSLVTCLPVLCCMMLSLLCDWNFCCGSTN